MIQTTYELNVRVWDVSHSDIVLSTKEPKMIKYAKGDVIAIAKASNSNLYLPHCVNDSNVMGSGVAAALFRTWMPIKTDYHQWFNFSPKFTINETGEAKLGNCQFVKVTDKITVVNMIGQSSPGGRKIVIGKEEIDFAPVRYQSMEECMLLVAARAKAEKVKKIVTVKFGCGLAQGKWEIIEPLIQKCWVDRGIDVTVVEP